MLYCAYCGKSFTRKEHLERHIPSHTNVKPHRCSLCQLSFSRRDLLQRHHSTYHEIRDSNVLSGDKSPASAGKTPIACMNCASAKTGCDKTVPCSRCAEKNLPCAARFARRASKLLKRATTGDLSLIRQAPETRNPSPTLLDATASIPSALEQIDVPICTSPDTACNQFGDSTAIASSTSLLQCDDFMPYHTDFAGSGVQYDTFGHWHKLDENHGVYPISLFSPEFGDITFSVLAENSSSDSGSSTSFLAPKMQSHTRNTSINSGRELKSWSSDLAPSDLSQLDATTMAAEAAWPIVRCLASQFSSSCPRTALLHLENLETSSHSIDLEGVDATAGAHVQILPMMGHTRDRLIGVAQGVLQKALSIHRGGIGDTRASCAHINKSGLIPYLVLPATATLDFFLQRYMTNRAAPLSCVVGGVLDANDLILRSQPSTLLVLLMIAEGAVNSCTEESERLAAGLTEICRISLFDMIEKDVELSADSTVLQCALLFACLGAWGGDKWHMDIVMGQRAMYIAMLKHSGALEPQMGTVPVETPFAQTELQWRAWLQVEESNRLVYNWVVIDLELSVFHDTAPIFQITDLQNRHPQSDQLWECKTAEQWSDRFSILTRSDSPIHSQSSSLASSLFGLFQDFLLDNIREDQLPSMLQLKLLLHPVHALLHHVRQTLSCFSTDFRAAHQSAGGLSRESTMGRLEEVQILLGRWHDLYILRTQIDLPSSHSESTLVLFHLLNLSVFSSFPELERLARKEAFNGTYWDMSQRHGRCIQHSIEAIFHSGQVIRLVRLMPLRNRPLWWPVAIYRATLTLFIDGLAKAYHTFSHHSSHEPTVVIDALLPLDPVLQDWRWNNTGTPVLMNGTGALTKLEEPLKVLRYGIDCLEKGSSARMTDGVRRKMLELHRNWTPMDHVVAPGMA